MRFGKTLLAVLLVATASAAQAGPAFTLSNTTGAQLGNNPYTVGFQFTANANLSVTALGLFDGGQDGLLESHDIGLYDSGGALLASTTLASGTTNPLTNQFRYATISATALTAGQTYTVGAVYNPSLDDAVFPGAATDFATDPAITFNQSAYIPGSFLQFPSSSTGPNPGYFGPNFLFSPKASVPEPAFVALSSLLSLGSGGLLLRRRHARA